MSLKRVLTGFLHRWLSGNVRTTDSAGRPVATTPQQGQDPAEVEELLNRSPFSVVHFDAKWDAQRVPVQERIRLLTEKISDTSFGYVDVDDHPAYARKSGISNVPACSCFRGTELVATVIGIQQDIEQNLHIVRNGGIPDTSNRISRM